jgi:hypothetical protein
VQVEILYERFDIYQQLLPPLVAKKAQSFQCGNQKGTLYYFEFANVASREEAEKFIRPLLWGTDRPTKQHPEQVEHGDALAIVVSFPKPPDALMTALRAKLSNAASATGDSLEAAGVHPLLGDWRGSSICLVKASACHDEEALYRVKAGAKPDTFSMQADKIVDGKPEEMGTADCSYDRTKMFLHCWFERGYVDLTLEGDSLNGAMFLTDKTRWREIKLVRAKK